MPHTEPTGRFLLCIRNEGHPASLEVRKVYPKAIEEIVPLYQQIGREIGMSYTLGYVSSNADKNRTFRQIEVRTKDGSLNVKQSRSGYNAR